MSKAGLLALTKSAAQEYAVSGIRINALVAGGFDTDMLRSALSQAVGEDPEKVRAAMNGYAGMVPLGRLSMGGSRRGRADALLPRNADSGSLAYYAITGGCSGQITDENAIARSEGGRPRFDELSAGHTTSTKIFVDEYVKLRIWASQHDRETAETDRRGARTTGRALEERHFDCTRHP